MKAGNALIVLGALALVAGCDRGASDRTGANNAVSAPAGVGNSATAGGPAVAGNQAARNGHETGRPTLVLAADGIMAGGTPQSRIAFGANSLDAIERVTPLLGASYDRGEGSECGAGPIAFANWGKVVLNFQQGELVGWELRQASQDPWIGTPGGATIGTPRSELQAALGTAPTVEQTSLGTEFSAGGFSGLLSADAADARVTALWAGTNCMMR